MNRKQKTFLQYLPSLKILYKSAFKAPPKMFQTAIALPMNLKIFENAKITLKIDPDVFANLSRFVQKRSKKKHEWCFFKYT